MRKRQPQQIIRGLAREWPAWKFVGSGHGQLREGGVVRLRNWMEDQEAASSSAPNRQDIQATPPWFHVRLSWLRIKRATCTTFSQWVNVNVHVNTTDCAANLARSSSLHATRSCMHLLCAIRTMHRFAWIDIGRLYGIDQYLIDHPLVYGALQFQILNSTTESSTYSTPSCSYPVLLDRRPILVPLLGLKLLPILSSARLRSA